MTSISISKDRVPSNAIIIQIDSKKPLGYSNDSSFYDKYIKSTLNAGTNPGNATGSVNHIHATIGDHNHTGNTPAGHTHNINFNQTNANVSNYTAGASNVFWTSHGHSHNAVSDSETPGVITASSDGSHQHATYGNEMAHKTEFFLKHSETTIGLRRKVLGQNSLFMWGKNATTLPGRYTKNTTLDGDHVKGVANANSTPDVAGGTHTHTHEAHSSHTHTMTMPSHTHGSAANSNTGPQSGVVNYNFGSINAGGSNIGHTHGFPDLLASNATNAASDSQTIAAHPSQTMEVAWKSIHYVQHTVAGLREKGVPIGGILLWTDLVANIPTGWQVADGTNGTSNYLDKYPRGENSNTNAGNTGGANAHTHAAGGGGHTHGSTNFSHAHTSNDSFGASWQYNTYNAPADTFNGNSLVFGHNHPLGIVNANDSGSLQSDTDSHTHDSQNHEPPGILVSFIERLA